MKLQKVQYIILLLTGEFYSGNIKRISTSKRPFIYVNGSYKSDTPLGKLVHDFNCTNANDMYYEKLAERVKYFKETKKGVETMCKAMELMRDETLLQGKIYGIIEASRDNGKTDAQIVAYIVAKYTSLSEKDAQKYIDEYSEV